jgi:hypothetical protein
MRTYPFIVDNAGTRALQFSYSDKNTIDWRRKKLVHETTRDDGPDALWLVGPSTHQLMMIGSSERGTC